MKVKNKKIGIVGGVGPQATQVLYEKIIELAQVRYRAKDNNDFPKVAIESVPVPDFITNTKNMNEAKNMLVEASKNLSKAGATKLCIGSNTVHLLLNELRKETNNEFFSIINLVGQRCQQLNLENVGVVGSSVTLNSELYSGELEKLGIGAILPSGEQKATIDKIIRDVLAGRSNKNRRREYSDILTSLLGQGAEAIILACTELPLAINYEALGEKIINSMDVLAEAIVDYYYT